MSAAGPLSVSALARRAALSARTVRFYADSGLLRPAERGPLNGYRYFGADAIERVRPLRRASSLGVR